MVTGVALGVLLAVAWTLVVRWWGRRPRRSKSDEWCGLCGKPVEGRRMHLFVSQPDDDVEAEFGGFGGTFVSVAYCKAHCPGRCRNRRCRAKLNISEPG